MHVDRSMKNSLSMAAAFLVATAFAAGCGSNPPKSQTTTRTQSTTTQDTGDTRTTDTTVQTTEQQDGSSDVKRTETTNTSTPAPN